MKVFRGIGRGIRDAFKSTIRNFSLSLAAISCIAITLLVVSIALAASLNLDNFTNNIKEDVTMVVFVDIKADKFDIERIDQEIRAIDNVESVTYKSKEVQKQEMIEESEVFETIMSEWKEEDSPLKDSFLVKVVNLENIKNTSEEITEIEMVDLVSYGELMVEKMLQTFSVLEKFLIVIMVILVFVTIVLITNTIKLTIFSRQEEISIMRLVGASNLTIRLPFIIEGMFLGLIGAIIPVIVISYGYVFLYNSFDGVILSSLIRLIEPYPFVFYVSLFTIFFGVIVGMIGSGHAVRKYLKI